jgi:hypothetical protein
MAYQSSIPNATDRISVSQGDIKGNFQALASWGNGYGNFTNQSGAQAAAGNDITMYNLTSSITGLPALFLNNAAGQISEFTSTQTGVFALASQSWTQLPSGVIVKWGNISSTALGTNTITFNPAYPAFTSSYQVIVSPQRGGAATDPNQALYASVTGLGTFNVYCYLRTGTGTITNVPFSWIAIGV